MSTNMLLAAEPKTHVGINPHHTVSPFHTERLRMGGQDATLALSKAKALGSTARLRCRHKGRPPFVAGAGLFLSLPLDAGGYARGLVNCRHGLCP
jgi:hypothetical protein